MGPSESSVTIYAILSVVGYLMQEFHRFWIEEDPSDIMEFNRVRSKFHRRILRQLKNPDMALCPHFAASDLHLVNM
ncbi:ELMO domain-containing protein 1 [Goodea atripinnis]|uniref:ELMO domain-containing protein 1 n=1 Tax=Goodea atripinnis TaxID=208336 RepID=A0ABV0PMB2_9TELE